MKNFPLILRVILVISVIYLASGCSGIPVVKRTSCGPSAVNMWAFRSEPYKSQEESMEYDKEVQVKIEEYLSLHPEVDKNVAFTLKEFNAVEEGMNKEQVELLYGKPDIITTDSKQLKYNTDEKWVYVWNPGEFRIYFSEGIVVAIEDKCSVS